MMQITLATLAHFHLTQIINLTSGNAGVQSCSTVFLEAKTRKHSRITIRKDNANHFGYVWNFHLIPNNNLNQ